MMRQTIKRIVLIGLAVVVLATMLALPAYAASPSDPGPVGYRWIPEVGRELYCDNFYDGPPMAFWCAVAGDSQTVGALVLPRYVLGTN